MLFDQLKVRDRMLLEDILTGHVDDETHCTEFSILILLVVND